MDDNQRLPVTQPPPPAGVLNPKIVLISLLVILVLIAGVYYFYKQVYGLKVGNPKVEPIVTPTPSPPPGHFQSYNTKGFNNCVFRKGKDKLITLAETQKAGTLFVAMAGNIMDLQSISDQTTITLIAPDGSQGYQFTLPLGEQIVWDSPQATTAKTVSELKSFLSVNVYATCNPKATGNKLTINQINITADLTKPKR